jgi:hypothetical protein
MKTGLCGAGFYQYWDQGKKRPIVKIWTNYSLSFKIGARWWPPGNPGDAVGKKGGDNILKVEKSCLTYYHIL